MSNASRTNARTNARPDHHPYGGNDWALEETHNDPDLRERSDSLFSQSNGFIGIRGDNLCCINGPGTNNGAYIYLNGVYETIPVTYHEKAHGFTETSDTRPAAINGGLILLQIDGAKPGPKTGDILSNHRRLDMKTGILTQTIRWKSPKGDEFDLVYERIVSLRRPAIMAQRLSIKKTAKNSSLDTPSIAILGAAFDATHNNKLINDNTGEAVHDPRLGPHFSESPWKPERLTARTRTLRAVHRLKKSGIGVAMATASSITGGAIIDNQTTRNDKNNLASSRYTVTLGAQDNICLDTFTAYVSDFGKTQSAQELEDAALYCLKEAQEIGFDGLCAEQRAELDQFWDGAAITIKEADRDTQALRFNMFHLLQAAGRGGHTSICAKGQTGEGYEGHYFWDAEVFCLPMFAFTSPEIARDMLLFRCHTLEQSRHNARLMGHKRGALIAWRTISGRECSAYFPAGSAQYHINADIAYALRTYIDATDDRDFLLKHGAELLFETARIWMEIGFFNPRKDGAFCINKVTGPDEYTALVDNNFYTNTMARAHLEFACETAQWMKAHYSQDLSALCRRLDLTTDEIAQWEKAAKAMYLPVDPALNIHPQDDSFLDRDRWDIAATPQQNFPLLLHYHPLTLYRYQVCKQADTVLAMVLEKDRFDRDIKTRDLAYYEGVTVHDSTLSAAAFGLLASHVGETDKALQWFRKATFVDLSDLHKNTGHGLHMASLGGSWLCLVMGFAGMTARNDRLSFDPQIPADWGTVTFRIRYRTRTISVTVSHELCHYHLLAGAPLDIFHRGTKLTLTANAKVKAA